MLLALDIASRTGWATYEDVGGGKPPRVRCGSWQCQGEDFDTKAESLAGHLTAFLRDARRDGERIEFAAIEEPFRRMPTKVAKGGMFAGAPQAMTNPHTMLVLHAMAGSACGILSQFHIPKVLVTVNEWRKSFIQTTRAPASVPRDKGSQWLKREVREKAQLLGNQYGFHVPNTDASDAIGIAFWLAANAPRLRSEDALRAKVAA